MTLKLLTSAFSIQSTIFRRKNKTILSVISLTRFLGDEECYNEVELV